MHRSARSTYLRRALSGAPARAALCALLAALAASSPSAAGDAVPARPSAGPPPAPAPPTPLSPADVAARWHGRLDQRRFTARVALTVSRGGASHRRRVRVWRDDGLGAGERLLVRFEDPSEVRGLGLLYLENPGGLHDYFLWQPALRRVRRIPEAVAREDLYGVDLEYLGFGVTPLEPTELVDLAADAVGGAPALRLRERALRPGGPRFDERVVWLDPVRFVPLRTEHVRRGRTMMTATTLRVREVQGVATPEEIRFERPGETVTMQVESIDYEAPIPDAFFSTLALAK